MCMPATRVLLEVSAQSLIDTPGTGWRGNVGCLKLQVSFCQRATDYRAFLRKETYKDEASYASLPPVITPAIQRYAAPYSRCMPIYRHIYIYIYRHIYI